jgi:hypothetical protein
MPYSRANAYSYFGADSGTNSGANTIADSALHW